MVAKEFVLQGVNNSNASKTNRDISRFRPSPSSSRLLSNSASECHFQAIPIRDKRFFPRAIRRKQGTDSRDTLQRYRRRARTVHARAFHRNSLQIMQLPTVTDWRLQFPRASYRRALQIFIVWRHSADLRSGVRRNYWDSPRCVFLGCQIHAENSRNAALRNHPSPVMTYGRSRKFGFLSSERCLIGKQNFLRWFVGSRSEIRILSKFQFIKTYSTNSQEKWYCSSTIITIHIRSSKEFVQLE